MESFKIILEPASGEIVEKKSRFIASIKPVTNEAEATGFIDEIKKKYWDAKHNCSAFVIGENNEITRCSDDGEPSGTAGRPMLEILTKEGYHNVCVVVTRYFGGVLLGTGGLIRAYQGAVKEGIASARIATVDEGIKYTVTVSYNDVGKLLNMSGEEGIIIDNTVYSENVSLDITVVNDKAQQLIKNITNITNGQAIIGEGVKTQIVLEI